MIFKIALSGFECVKEEKNPHSTDKWCKDLYNVQGLCPRPCRLVADAPVLYLAASNFNELSC